MQNFIKNKNNKNIIKIGILKLLKTIIKADKLSVYI